MSPQSHWRPQGSCAWSGGFFVTVISIVLLQETLAHWGDFAVWLLLPGPALGLLAMRPLLAVRAAP